MLSLVFLQPNLAAAVAAAIASVALLVAVVIVVDLRHDGFKNKEREGGWGGGRSASRPRRLGGSRCSVPLPCCCSLVGFVVAGFVPYSSCCWLFCRYLEKHRSREAKTNKAKSKIIKSTFPLKTVRKEHNNKQKHNKTQDSINHKRSVKF